MTARIMAREQEIPVLEAETILQEILLDVEDEISMDLDIETLDADVKSLGDKPRGFTVLGQHHTRRQL